MGYREYYENVGIFISHNWGMAIQSLKKERLSREGNDYAMGRSVCLAVQTTVG